MRIAVVGTSNSISRTGWLLTFRSLAKGHEVVNLSLGACPILQAAQTIIDKKVADQFDYCIIELPVNDQRYIDAGFLDENVFAAWFAEALSTFGPESRCKPLALLLPHRNSLRHPKRSYRAAAVARMILNAREISYVDIERDLERGREIFGSLPGGCFEDWGHLLPKPSRIVGFAVQRALPLATHGNALTLPSIGLRVHAIGTLANLPLKHRKNSLVDVHTAVLDGPLEFQQNGFLCGVQHWTDESTGVLRISSSGTNRYKNLKKIWPNVLFLTDFQPAVPGGKITLSVVEDGSGSEAVISPSKAAPGGQLELASVLMSEAEPMLIGKDILASIEKAPATSRWIEDPAVYRNIYQ